MTHTKYNKTKIIATLGPATSDIPMLTKIFKAGVDVCRINFSHGSWEVHKEVIENVREVNRQMGKRVCILWFY